MKEIASPVLRFASRTTTVKNVINTGTNEDCACLTPCNELLKLH